MSIKGSTGKRLAKNTVFMYVRMALLMIISLYTSRIVLQQLGVEDYGVYNLVGSFIAMFASLRTLFASSTQRFINYEIGKGHSEKINNVFNISIIINVIISIIFIILVEAIGIWFINEKLVIDPARFTAANWVFHFAVLSAVVSILTTSYDAMIIAHERMDFYAINAILEGVLRLAVVFMLSLTKHDKLIAYALMQLSVSFIIYLINVCFCLINFKECKHKFIWNSKLFFEMSSFAGWNFLGNTSYSITQSGFNMLLNVFYGVIANAARGIAYQVNHAVNQILHSVIVVINPYCVKTYASGNKVKTFEMIYFASKLYFTIQACIVTPLCIMSYDILNLWLGVVPEYTVIFMQLVLLHTLLRSIHTPLNTLFIASGKLKHYQIAEMLILSLPLLASYFMFKLGCPPYSLFIAIILFEIINYVVIIYLAKIKVKLPLKEYIRNVICPCLIELSVAFLYFIICNKFIHSIILQILISTLSVITLIFILFKIGLNKNEYKQIIALIKK